MMIVLLLFLQKQNLANAIYLFGLGTLLPAVPECCLHKIYFLKTKKAEKAQKTKTAVKKTVFNFSTDMLLIFWRWPQPFFNASLGQDSSPGS